MALKCPECTASGADCPYGTPAPDDPAAYGPWIAHHPLGRCDLCRTPTWNPVTWYSRLALGRAGHYYCETCGPAMLELALASGERVEDAAGLAP